MFPSELNKKDEHENRTFDKNTTTINSKKTIDMAGINNEFYAEKRYCTKCNLEQPLRCKHCIHCERCVGTYDHHCAWIGKNK